MPTLSGLQPASSHPRSIPGGFFHAHDALGSPDDERHSLWAVDRTWVLSGDEPDPIGTISSIVGDRLGRVGDEQTRWAIMLGYELGMMIEPSVAESHQREDEKEPFPLAVIQRLRPGSSQDLGVSRDDITQGFELGALGSSMGRARYIQAVERTREYIAAGDIYQANIAHHLIGSFSGDAAAISEALIAASDPRYGCVMGFDWNDRRHVICSLSPELFLRFDPKSGLISSRPMKGTRPIGGDRDELFHAPKDRAELDMITDLMRNDLGRVCTLGSVRVRDPRLIEAHGSGVLQASSIVQGRLAPSTTLGSLIRATFPPGSVTGAPKVRAMQIINQLEARPRGCYCGSLLTLDEHGGFVASVAIRTAHIWGGCCPNSPNLISNGQFSYPVGAGIVADSDPCEEWEETRTKAEILARALGAQISND